LGETLEKMLRFGKSKLEGKEATEWAANGGYVDW
jgi:hypothetical protein